MKNLITWALLCIAFCILALIAAAMCDARTMPISRERLVDWINGIIEKNETKFDKDTMHACFGVSLT